MDRKNFIKSAGALGLGSAVSGKIPLMVRSNTAHSKASDRQYWIKMLTKIADPVLEALSQEKLKKKMPIETNPNTNRDRTPYTHLEAFGRLMTGMAPWLELGKSNTAEGKLRAKYIDLARSALANAVNPNSPDFLNYNKGSQPLVDAAFLAHALIKAPNELWIKSSEETQKNILKALKSSRVITPYYSNWVLFSAMIEAALQKFNDSGDMVRMDLAVRAVEGWYLGDGIYGDGSEFHWDYYNSYVIQPFMLAILNVMQKKNPRWKKAYNRALKHSRRYAEILQRMIAPDGTYPAIGRSITYRYGAFQLLSQLAWNQQLPDQQISLPGVRSSLTDVIKKTSSVPGMFNDDGWLQIGLYGHQPHLAEGYISTGSLYLCSAVFLPLGLPAKDKFWDTITNDSIEEKIWSGQDVSNDHHL